MPRAFASCPSNLVALDFMVPSSIIAAVDGGCQLPGYSLLEVPDILLPVSDGYVIENDVHSVCNNGYMLNGTCTSYSSGDCTSPNYALGTDTATFEAVVDNKCRTGGYSVINVSSGLIPLMNGTIIGSARPTCDAGYLSNGTDCIVYTTSENCPTGYVNLVLDANTFAELTNNTCSDPYATFTGTTKCDNSPGATCLDLVTPVININWMDGENTITTNTCLYDGTITLPAEPTRPGYTFAGWRLAD